MRKDSLLEIVNEIAQVVGQHGAGEAWSESIRQRLIALSKQVSEILPTTNDTAAEGGEK